MNYWIIYTIAAAIVGIVIGFIGRRYLTVKALKDAEARQKELIVQAKEEALKIKEEAKKEGEEKSQYLHNLEVNLRRREENIEHKLDSLDKDKENLQHKEKEIDQIKNEILEIKVRQEERLQKIAKITKEEAKDILLANVEKEYHQDMVTKIKSERARAKEEIDIEARNVLSAVIQRLASEHTAETTIDALGLPNDEMKGRIIGREGRNIQIFEKETGVDLIIDDTPDTVVISAFDPIRRQVAKRALDKLVQDGRIQPTRIEEAVAKAKEEISTEIKEAGEQAAFEVGVAGLHPDLIKILGRLKFRTSYGQNVLKHSIESAHIAGMLAAEIGADVNLSKKAALLHDVGKAVDHDVPGSHLQISCDICKKYGQSQDVIDAVQAHHEGVEPKTVEAILVKAADAISGARPGARRETLENYVKRLEELENLANAFPGVEKSYAIQAGREVRILVKPDDIDDLGALKLSKDIAQKIEKELQYPGTIKVNVIREVRAVEFAK